jgi:carbamoyltransferase
MSTNSTAALMKDGRIVACASEERFSRKKNTNDYPRQALDFCLRQGNVSPSEIDLVALAGYKFSINYWLVDHDNAFSVKDKIREQYDYWYPRLYENEDPDFLSIFSHKIIPQHKKALEVCNSGDPRISLITEHLRISEERIRLFNHHDCHAYYAYYGSHFRGDGVLNFVVEGFGDDANASISEFKDGELIFHYRTDDCYIGRLYRYITLLLGMKSNEHEYKVMGLAPYAKEAYYKEALDIFNSYMYVDGFEFKYHKRPKDLFFQFKKEFEHIRFDNIAGALQKYVELLLTQWVANACSRLKRSKIVFSGGVGMNIKALMEIAKLPLIEDAFVCPTGSDESLAIGACYHAFKTYNPSLSPAPIKDVYLGNDISSLEAKEYILKNNINSLYKVKFDVKPEDIAQMLVDKYVIARISGRMEFGARALGDRSILADPRDYSIVAKINDKIKRRDFWMPFAPVILKERVQDYLKNPKQIEAPFMTIGFETTDLARDHFPAGLHPADHTARPQVVSESDNPEYYKIVKAFEKLTGVGALVNTSFNLHGEPIVSSCEDALDVFEKTSIDALLLNNYLIIK